MSRRFERRAPLPEEAVSLQTLLPDAVIRGCRDLRVHAVTCDSRLCRPGDLFVALRGVTTDGHHYLPQAVQNGAVAVVVVPSGDNSVMPQLVCTLTPRRCSRRSIRACGTDEPPSITRSSDGTSPPVCSRWSASPSHTVATPAATVTPSALISLARLAPS